MEPNKKNSKIQSFFQLIRSNFKKKQNNTIISHPNHDIKKDKKKKLDYSYKKFTELPKNYAEELLNLELEMEEINPPSITQLKKLLELYIIGVEFYEATHSQRYLIFKNKINVLMTKPNILSILNKEESLKKIENSIDSNRVLVSKQEKKKMMDLHVFLTSKQSDESIEDKAKNLMRFQENTMSSLNNIVRKEIDLQTKSILDRIEDRKRAISFIETSIDNQMEENKSEEYKKNSLLLLKKNSKNIGCLVNKLQLRNSLKKSKTMKEKEDNEEIEEIIQKYEKELVELKRGLKDKGKSLLITKLIDKIELEREKAIESIIKKN